MTVAIKAEPHRLLYFSICWTYVPASRSVAHTELAHIPSLTKQQLVMGFVALQTQTDSWSAGRE